ncbi:MAG: tetratricopeptide repeat protein [Verrucomicrobiae bacterium]|nr:tetratricopeptide repeat protein [Verrucomicrobiae bacterium]
MQEINIQDLDERFRKQIDRLHSAFKKGGYDFVIQVSGELLNKSPGAWEVRSILCDALLATRATNHSRMGWLRDRSNGMQFKISVRSQMQKDPLSVVRRCDEQMRNKVSLREVFECLDKAAQALEWPETRTLARRAIVQLEPDNLPAKLAYAEVLLELSRPKEAVEQVEWVLAREPSNGEAQTLLKNASVAETLQRGNWEDTNTTFHSKKQS